MAVAAMAVRGEALKWWLCWSKCHPQLGWDEFTTHFLWQFKTEYREVLSVAYEKELEENEKQQHEEEAKSQLLEAQSIFVQEDVTVEEPKESVHIVEAEYLEVPYDAPAKPTPSIVDLTPTPSQKDTTIEDLFGVENSEPPFCVTASTTFTVSDPVQNMRFESEKFVPEPEEHTETPERVWISPPLFLPPPPLPLKPPDQVSLPLSPLPTKPPDWYSTSDLQLVGNVKSDHFISFVLDAEKISLDVFLADPHSVHHKAFPPSDLLHFSSQHKSQPLLLSTSHTTTISANAHSTRVPYMLPAVLHSPLHQQLSSLDLQKLYPHLSQSSSNSSVFKQPFEGMDVRHMAPTVLPTTSYMCPITAAAHTFFKNSSTVCLAPQIRVLLLHHPSTAEIQPSYPPICYVVTSQSYTVEQDKYYNIGIFDHGSWNAPIEAYVAATNREDSLFGVQSKQWDPGQKNLVFKVANCSQLKQWDLGGYLNTFIVLNSPQIKQWDPGDHLFGFTTAWSCQFKLWDPGKFLMISIFFNLEDKVDVKGNGI